MLNAIAKNVPWLIGGAADLAPSTKTRITEEGAGDFQAENYGGRNFHFGIREHAMGAILNGLCLVKVRPFGAGFFIFVDYMRGSMRLSALMEIPVIYVFTHDSIGVGEDGPTHQPIEQLAHMRSMPGLIVIRPADANEVVEAWKVTYNCTTSRQCSYSPARLYQPSTEKYSSASGLARGAYVLADAVDGSPEVILIGTGSEVALCLEAYEQLTKEGIRARVVSMPSGNYSTIRIRVTVILFCLRMSGQGCQWKRRPTLVGPNTPDPRGTMFVSKPLGLRLRLNSC